MIFREIAATHGAGTMVSVISIVDDDGSARSAAERLVRSLGWHAQAFASAEEFLQSPRLAETRCLIADVRMPRVGGLELQSRLIAQGHRIPIVFMTAFCEDNVRVRALAAGAVCVLSKPLQGPTLSRCIEAALLHDAGPAAR
jgi:FixJ family two-component response regulator